MPTPRYVRQNDHFSCGPVAIANAMKWAGLKFSYAKSRERFLKACNCQNPVGTTTRNFERALRELTDGLIEVKRRYGASTEDIKNHIKDGGSVVVCGKRVWDFQLGSHYFNCVDYDGNKFLVTNETPSGSVNGEEIYSWLWLTKKQFEKKIDSGDISDELYRTKYPKAWFLTKIDGIKPDETMANEFVLEEEMV